MVEVRGFEPPAPWSQTMCATKLRYTPIYNFYGGEGGIRTHVGLHPNGFQDRLVMTASIPLRENGDLSATRTRDTLIKSQVLYRLS